MTTTQEPIDLLSLDDTEGPEVRLPNGRVVRIQLYDAAAYQLWERIMADVKSGTADYGDSQVLLQRAIPTLTTEERESLSVTMVWFIGQAAARKANALIEVLRKNGDGLASPNATPAPAADASAPADSLHSTRSLTSASKSGESKADRTDPSSDNPSASPSPP